MIFVVAGLLAIIITGHLLLFPYEIHDSDEAAYAYVAEGWLKGEIPYISAYQTKPPGIYAIYALGLILTPHGFVGIRWLSFLAMGLSVSLLLYWVNTHFRSKRMTLFSAYVGVLLFLNTSIEAEAALTELFALPFLLGMFILATPPLPLRSFPAFWFGLLGSLGTLITVYTLPFMVMCLWFSRSCWRKDARAMKAILTGFLLPLGIVATYFVLAGAGNGIIFSLWVWPSRYAQAYFLSNEGFSNALFFFPYIAPFFVAMILGIGWKISPFKQEQKVVGVWFGLSFLILFAVGSFFPHHAMLGWFPLAVGGGVFAARTVSNRVPQIWSMSGIMVMLILGVATIATSTHMRWVPDNPNYAEIGRAIQTLVPEGKPIYVWGYMPQIYWYAQRRAPTPYFDSFSLIFADRLPMREEDRKKVEQDFLKNPPRVMVVHPLYQKRSDIQPFLLDYQSLQEYPTIYVRTKAD